MSIKDQTIAYSILELASVAYGSSVSETFSKSLELAQLAEQWNYSRFWLAEHHNMISIASSAPQVLIGYIAGGTKRIKVGSGGIMLPNHSPLIVAEQFGTLGALYPGRIDLGLGRAPGTDQVTANAIRPERMTSVYRFPDEISMIQQYFSPDNKNAKVRAPVAEGVNVPFFILGSSTDSAYVAAQKGLPYAFASHFAPAMLLQALDIYRTNFRPSTYLSEPYTIAGINVIAAETDEKAEFLSTTLVNLILGVLTGNIDYVQEPVEMSPEIRSFMENPAFERMLKYAFIGSKETVKTRTQEFLALTGVDELMVVSHLYHHQDRLYSYQTFSEIMLEINRTKAKVHI